MKAYRIVLPSLALGAATLLLAPGPTSQATFTLTGQSLGISQRDFRVFNNFSDAASNNNVTPDPMFPGYDGAELAIWKGVVEWGSLPHGDGSGDPVNGNVLGSGGANYDPAWAGNASASTTNNNIHGATNGGGACSTNGVIAFAELPSDNGWRIRYCDNQWIFDDGPGNVGINRFDIQEITTHEQGHVIGLGHSCTGSATMFPSTSLGSESGRSINFDDRNGIQAVYGVASPTKPTICETSVAGGQITIRGTNFNATTNNVWFTNVNTTSAGSDPRIIASGVPSSNGGTEITVTIPAGAGPGDVLVKAFGGGNDFLSNAFPTDLVGTISASCPGLSVTSTTPSTVDPLVPGTTQFMTISGAGFNSVTSIEQNGDPIDSSRYTIVDDNSITLDPPQGVLGANTLLFDTGSDTASIDYTTVINASPMLELGTGEVDNVIPDGTNMNVIAAGTVGTTHRLYYSTSPIPSTLPIITLDMGNNFTNLFIATSVVIGAEGYSQFQAPISFAGPATVFYNQSIDLSTPPAPMFGVSNLQSITLTP